VLALAPVLASLVDHAGIIRRLLGAGDRPEAAR
jgi:hypothetical protein